MGIFSVAFNMKDESHILKITTEGFQEEKKPYDMHISSQDNNKKHLRLARARSVIFYSTDPFIMHELTHHVSITWENMEYKIILNYYVHMCVILPIVSTL